jgi:hypothetical protein
MKGKEFALVEKLEMLERPEEHGLKRDLELRKG